LNEKLGGLTRSRNDISRKDNLPDTATRRAIEGGKASQKFRDVLADGAPIMADGAMGTMLFANGLTFGDPTEVLDPPPPHVTRGSRGVSLANPHSRHGSYLQRAGLWRVQPALPREVLLVVDQAYAEYLDPADDDGALELAAAHGNVLVTRTFSKIFGLAGERVGWATGAAPLIATLNRIRGPFNVTNSAQAMALAALGDEKFVERSRELNRTERERFAASLAALGNHGIRVLPSEANFVLVLFEGALSAEAALAGVARAGFAVATLPGPGLAPALPDTHGLPRE